MVKDVNVDGDYVSVPVAPGMDGKVWKIGGPSFGLGFFKFFNVPNFFFAKSKRDAGAQRCGAKKRFECCEISAPRAPGVLR